MATSWWHQIVWRRMAKAARKTIRQPLRFEPLEDRVNPARIIGIGSDPGSLPFVTGLDEATGQQKFSVLAFDASFTGGVNVAVGDVNGDGTADLIAGAGLGGGSFVKVFSGVDGSQIKTFQVGDDASRAGASVAAADFDGDGVADIVIGTTRNGQPIVQVLRFSDGTVLHGFTPFMGASSVSVAAGDVNGDGTPDVIVGSGAGITAQITVFNGATDAALFTMNAFEATFTGGVHVAAGDVNGDGRADIVAAAAVSGGPRVQIFSGLDRSVIANFFSYDSGLRDGTRAALADSNGDGVLDLVTANGPGHPTELKAFDPRTAAALTAPTYPGLPASASYDVTAPTVTLATTAAEPTNTTPIPVTATFDEPVNGFAAAGVTATNGTVSNFVRVDARTYTFDVTPTADGAVTVTVAAGAASDAAGNENTASAPLTRTFDSTGPQVTANALTTNDNTPTLTGTVTDSAATVLVTVSGQTVTATVSGNTWSATIPNPLADGTYDIQVAATDTANNTGNTTLSNGLVVDTTAPTATVSSTAPEPTGTVPIPFTVTFSEPVTGLVAGEIAITNGTISNFAGSGTTYTFDVAPVAAGAVTVTVPANVAQDAAGNQNVASNTVNRTFTTGTIGLTGNTLVTNDTTPTLTGTVDDPNATVTVTVDGQTVTATVTGNDWSATIPTALAEGTYDIFVNAMGASSTFGNLTVAGGLVIDLTAPSATLTTTATSPTNAASVPFTVTFDEDVTGFGVGGITVMNGSASNVMQVDAKTYTFDVAPGGEGDVSVTVDAGTASDQAGNASTASNTVTFTSDTTAPTVDVTSSASNPTTTSPILFTITFSENITGFDATDITVANGSVLDLAAVDGQTFMANVVPSGPNVAVSVSVAAGVAQDLAGNGNDASNVETRQFTGTVTSATITTAENDPTNADSIPFTITFTDAVTGFDDTDLNVGNGMVSNFAGSGTTYTFDVAPMADGDVTVSIAAGAGIESSNNPTAAATFTITSDRTAPTATVASSAGAATNTSPIPFTVTFSEDVTGFDETGLDVTNGTVQNFTTVDAQTYQFEVVPGMEGDVVVSVKADAAQDAAGNTNPVSAAVTVVYDTTAPTILSVTADNTGPTNAATVTYTVTFSEPVVAADVDASDFAITIVSGTFTTDPSIMSISPVTAGDTSAAFTVVVSTGTGEGTFRLDVPETATIADAAGNAVAIPSGGFVTGDEVTVDTVAPTAAITDITPNPRNVPVDEITITFSEAVTGFDLADLSLLLDSNGVGLSGATLTSADNITWTLGSLTSLTGAEGTYTLTLTSAGSGITDAIGNPLAADAVATWVMDTTAPAAPVISGLDPATDTGAFNNDGVTSNTSPTITGTAEADATVEVFADDGQGGGPVSLGTTTAAGDGSWSFTPSSALPEGTYTITATATDAAGNTGSPSAGFTLVIDVTAPTVAIDSAPSSSAITGTSDDGTGSGVTGVQLSIFDPNAGTSGLYWDGTGFTSDTEVLLTATDTSSGGDWSTWSYDFTGAPGTYAVHAIATDLAGNEGTQTTDVTIPA